MKIPDTNKLNTLDIKGVEINFVYSFLCSISDFSLLHKRIDKLTHNGERHEFMTVEQLAGLINDNKIDENTFYWTKGMHPKRIGLAPLLRIGRHLKDDNTKAVREISFFKKTNVNSFVETFTKTEHNEEKFNGYKVPVKDFDVVLRLMDNGTGTITIKFNLNSSEIEKHIKDNNWSKEQKLYDKLGLLPFIYAIYTLGRTELSIGGLENPYSLISNEKGEEFSLFQYFEEFLKNKFIDKINQCTYIDENGKSIGPSEILKDLDENLKMAHYTDNGNKKIPWQSPYVCSFIDLKKESSYCHDKSRPWWFSHFTFNDKKCSEGDFNLEHAYKEVVLILLRLYQWRDFLKINEILNDEDTSLNHENYLNDVVMPPELFLNDNNELRFRDINLVWDAKYLMLFHIRSTLVLNCVGESSKHSTRENFKELFRQSVLHFSEVLRSQWHAAVILGLEVDELIDKLITSESSRDIELLTKIAKKRLIYAKLLRDPLSIGTDAAALSEVREKAQEYYQIKDLYSSLNMKFQTIDSLISDQSLIQNLKLLNAK